MDGVGFEPSVIADCAQECHGLYPDVGIVHLDTLVLRRPRPCGQSVEGEHGLVHPHKLHIPESGDLDGVVHLSKEVVVVRVGVVDHLLAAMDELELDAALLVCPLEKRCRDLELWKGAVKHDGPLNQGEVCPLSERLLVAEVVNKMRLELRPLSPLDRLVFYLLLHATLVEVSDS